VRQNSAVTKGKELWKQICSKHVDDYKIDNGIKPFKKFHHYHQIPLEGEGEGQGVFLVVKLCQVDHRQTINNGIIGERAKELSNR
jgi:hypothetical protein